MNTQLLLTYLNDHLAGSVTAIELLDRLIEEREKTGLQSFLIELRADIVADQDELKRLIHGLGGEESAMKKASAWFADKLTRVKLSLSAPGNDALALFESLEALALGILGKRALWRALAVLEDKALPLSRSRLADLEQRAEDQHARVDARRVEQARVTFMRAGC